MMLGLLLLRFPLNGLLTVGMYRFGDEVVGTTGFVTFADEVVESELFGGTRLLFIILLLFVFV